jgi:hypothetical protein
METTRHMNKEKARKELNEIWKKYPTWAKTAYASWPTICKYETLSENFIRVHKDLIAWYELSIYQTLSENIIREMKDYVLWAEISYYQILSEDFIREMKDYVDWDMIAYKQKLSYNFIREFQDKLDLGVLLDNETITQQQFNKLIRVTRNDLIDI